MGGVERRSRRGHALVKFGPYVLSFPSGVLGRDLLRSQIKLAGKTEEEFLKNV